MATASETAAAQASARQSSTTSLYTSVSQADKELYTNWLPTSYADSGLSTATYLQTQTLFNLTNLAPYQQIPEGYIGHVFMCRPDLNLSENNIDKLRKLPTTAGLLTSQDDLESFKMLSGRSKTKWLPIVSNKAKNFTVTDMELKSIEKGEGYYGQSVRYAKHNEEYKHGGSISLEFRNDRYNSILKTMWFWTCYMYNVTKEDYLEVEFDNLWNGKLDYCASIFFLLTKRDGRELVYWDELVGVFPRRIPLSDFTWNDNIITNDTVTIDFEYSIRRDPLDPGILADINCLSNNDPGANNQKIIRHNPTNTMVMNDIWSKGPVIKSSTNVEGNKAYFLEFLTGGIDTSDHFLTSTNY